MALTACLNSPARAQSPESPIVAARRAAMESRVTKRFDFDERKLGNFETMPMNWRQLVEPGYPRFLEPRIDESIGHDAAPSFQFQLTNGNLGAYYLARDIAVDPSSAYRITAWIKPRGLNHGAAFLTAGYLGQNLKLMPSTERHSELVRGGGDNEPWTRVVIDLPGGVEHARCITLSCRVEQTVGGKPAAGSTPADVTYHDVTGAAWFDDITIVRMPRIRLDLTDPQGVFESGIPPAAVVGLRDLNCSQLSLELDLFDADGRLIDRHAVDPHAAFCWPVLRTFPKLVPGIYTARLKVQASEEVTETTQRRFVVLAAPPPGFRGQSRSFGVILSDEQIKAPEALVRLSRLISAGVAKINVWRGDMNDKAVVVGGTLHEHVVTQLADHGIKLVGVIDSTPESLKAQYPPDERSLIDILAGDPSQWRPYLALVLSRFSTRMSYWQLGADQSTIPDDPKAFQTAISQVDAELRSLTASTPLSIPVSARLDPAAYPRQPSIINLVQSSGPAMQFVSQLDELNVVEGTRWATIRPLDLDRYDRQGALIDFARAMIESRSRGFDIVFNDAPWTVREEDGREIVEPTETLIMLRTLSQELAGLRRVDVVHVAPGVEARLFSNADDSRGALVVWTEGRHESVQHFNLDVGARTTQIDLWENRRELAPMDHGIQTPIGALPTILSPVDPALVRLSSSFVLDKPEIAPTIEEHQRTLTFTNTTGSRIAGKVKVSGPRGWLLSPRQTFVDVNPGQSAKIPIRIRLPANQTAGEYELIGRLRISDDMPDDLTLRARVDVDMPGLEVDVLSYRENDQMRIVQRVTNRTNETLNLRASITSPGMPQQWRAIQSLPPGDSAIRNFDLPNPESLAGKAARVSVEQVGGHLRHNQLIKFE